MNILEFLTGRTNVIPIEKYNPMDEVFFYNPNKQRKGIGRIRISIGDKKYETILNDMICKFYGRSNVCGTVNSTEQYCRDILNTCLTGFHKDGRLWKSMPDNLQKRLRVFNYNLKEYE